MPRADAQLRERLLATFRVEADEHLQALRNALLELDVQPSAALVEATFREMHTLKGAARSVGLMEIEKHCQDCESLLSRLSRDGALPDGDQLASLERSVALIARLVDGGEQRPDAAAAEAPPREASIRMSAAGIDAVLRQGEELLAAKLAADEWVARAEALVEEVRRGDRKRLEASVRELHSGLLRDRRAIAAAVDGLLDETRRVRMTQAATVLELFPRMVRDLAEQQRKQVDWVTSGGEAEIDRRVLEAIKDPLIHLVRNAVDHGIEMPQDRRAAGKRPRGRVSVEVRTREGGRIEIAVADDGRGIDPARVREAAQRARVLDGDRELSEREALDLIFHSGLSTSYVITDVSGHGLGMAIVKEQVERLGGRVEVESRPDAGTTVRLLVPASIASFRGLLVRAAGQPFLIALDAVERVVRAEPAQVSGREAIMLDAAVLPVAALDALLELDPAPEPEDAPACVILAPGGDRVAVRVDAIEGDREVLVKELAPPLVHVRNVAGAGLLGAGELVLILRPIDLVRGTRDLPRRALDARAAEPRRPPMVLVVDDALTTRTMERSLLETAGYGVKVAVDGLDAWTTLRTEEVDLVVSDVDMPRMDGFELTARIRADERLQDLPVVLVSALEARADKERGIEVGANAYVVKSSFERSNLLDIIRRLGVRPLEGSRP
jgi:two-component system chemotaxis sensor kinase CheA